MSKKILSVLLCAALLLSVLSIGLTNTAFADYEGYTISGDFVIDEASGTLVAYTGGDKDIVVPDNLGIKIIGESAFAHGLMESLVLPGSLEEICPYAFSNCYYLKSITIPDDVAFIGEGAFYSCPSLITISLPDNVEAIGASTFENCISLTTINLPDSVAAIGVSAFFNCTALTTISLPDGITSIGASAFFNCTALTTIIFPDGVTSIAASAFSNCTALTTISLPDGVTSIGDSVFYSCTALTTINIPNSVDFIGSYAFYNCTALTTISIPDNVTYIGDDVFSKCESLTAINVSDENKNYSSADGVLFNKGKIELIKYPEGKPDEAYSVPDSVTYINDFAFENCTSLTAIIVGDDNEDYSSDCGVLFDKAKTILIKYPEGKADTSYSIPGSVIYICDSAFSNCEFIKTISVPDSVTEIGLYAFSNCTALTTINIPDGVTSIKGETFYKCISLITINIPEGVTSIAYSAFRDCTSLPTINIPDSVDAIDDFVFYNCTSLTAIIVGNDNEGYSSAGGVLFNKNKTELIQYPAGKPDEAYSIPNSVISIKDDAFAFCASLTTINIPDSVTNIGDDVFDGCASLVGIIVGDENKNYSSVDGVLFNEDKSMILLYPAGKPDESYTIPDSVAYIDDSAFSNCTSLITINIPNTVDFIGWHAFYNCTALTTISIPDSVTDIDAYAFEGCDNITICGSSGSYAQRYAKENKIPFIVLGGEEPTTDPTAPTDPTGSTDPTDPTADTTTTPALSVADGKKEQVRVDEDNKKVIINSKGISLDEFYAMFETENLSVKDNDGNAIDSKDSIIGTGVTVTVLDSDGKATGEPYTVIIMGDVNGDGLVKTTDARTALRAAVKIDPLIGAFLDAAKIGGNEMLKTSDARKILRVAVNIDAAF